MTTSRIISSLSDPKSGEKVSKGTFGYLEARNRGKAYELVISEFLRSGISQAELARRMGITPPQINRMLGAPGNWTLDTLSNLLFAISSAQPDYNIEYPMEAVSLNDLGQSWLEPNDSEAEVVMNTQINTTVFDKIGVTANVITPNKSSFAVSILAK
jgi:transcriptional regulator with XRE-family HTH domain